MIDKFRTAPQSRQLLIGAMLLVLLCALLGAAYFTWFRTSYQALFTDLRQAEAAAIVGQLEKESMDYRLADGGTTVLVPEGQVDAIRLKMVQQEVPLQGGVGFELFNSSSIGLTEFAQRINLQRALQGELARTIMNLSSIESARVHLTVGEQSVFRGDRRPARASVAVTTRRGAQLTMPTVRGIQRLVAGSVPEMNIADVVVLDEHGNVVSGDLPVEAPVPPGMEERRAAELFFEARIRRALEDRYSAEALDVRVLATLGGPDSLSLDFTTGVRAGEARGYPLRVTVNIAAPLGESERQRVSEVVQDAIGVYPEFSDVITVAEAPPAPQYNASGDMASGAAASSLPLVPRRDENIGASGIIWIVLVASLVAIGLVWLRRRRGFAGELSEQQRLQYVARLKALLDQRDIDAIPTA